VNSVPSAIIRSYRDGDEHEWLALLRAAPDFDYAFFNRTPSLDALRIVLEHPAMDATHNLFFAEQDGHIVGYAELWYAPGRGRAIGRVLVHPAWRQRGLGTSLLQHMEARGRTLGGHYLDIQIGQEASTGRAFLGRHGFRPVHYSWSMILEQVSSAPSPEWPTGYGQRTFEPGRDERTSVQLENESFRDEWEFTPVEVGEVVGFQRSSSFRADGIIFAISGGQVVGECWNWIDDERIAQTGARCGDVWCLCVHPQHRRRGLGKALLLAGVQWLGQQGMSAAALYVDGSNERAKHLYESAGFVTRRALIWYREDL